MRGPLSPTSMATLHTLCSGPWSEENGRKPEALFKSSFNTMCTVDEDTIHWDDTMHTSRTMETEQLHNATDTDMLHYPAVDKSPCGLLEEVQPIHIFTSGQNHLEGGHLRPTELSPQRMISGLSPKAVQIPAVAPGPHQLAEHQPAQIRLEGDTTLTPTAQDDTGDEFSRTEQRPHANEMVRATSEDESGMDDSCFTTFSEIPNVDMTLFRRVGEAANLSPDGKQATNVSVGIRKRSPTEASRSPSPTPRRLRAGPPSDGTMNLIDFTQQIEAFSTASQQALLTSPGKLRRESNLLSFINGQRSPAKRCAATSTPRKNNVLLSLLDFDLPPAPTPRSRPTITVRELESVKSSYQSQISSLRATLSGKEAEVESLKKAIGDAERRVGQATEALREERNAREHVEKEKAEWERRGTEVEAVLNSIKEEVLRSDREKEELLRKLEESGRRVEEAMARANRAETAATSACLNLENKGPLSDQEMAAFVEAKVQQRLDEKIESVSRDLHALYKKKHETKITTLKKSYETKAEKKCAALHQKVAELTKENDEFRTAKDATLSGVLPYDIDRAAQEPNLKLFQSQQAEIEEQKARLAGMSEEMEAFKREHAQTLRELEQERVEKGELVAAVDEMLALQGETGNTHMLEDFRKSVQRPSGLKAPGIGSMTAGFSGESRLARPAPTGLNRSVSGGKSRMMSNIERMGRNM